MVRRFIYDPKQERVIEVDGAGWEVPPALRYRETEAQYRASDSDRRSAEGQRLKEASLERADRREWAHKRFADERRWTE